MNGSGLFLQLLEKYRLRRPVPADVRARMVRDKRKTLRHILQQSGELSMGVRAALPLYRAIRGMGLAPTFRQGRIAASAMVAMVFCVLFAGLLTVSRPLIAPSHPDSGVVIFALGEVTRSGADGTTAPLKTRDFLEKGDRIKTGEDAAAIVQIGDTIMVRLQPRSELSVESLLSDPDLALSLRSGTVLARLQGLVKDRSFTVKAQTVTASVRGTAFSVTAGAPDIVAVAEGTVSVKHDKNGTGQLINADAAADGGDELVKRPITRTERLEIERVLRIPFMKDPMDAPQKEFEDLAALVQKNDAEIDATLNKPKAESIPGTLDEIRAKYGRIDVVYLYSGETVRGAIIGRGETIRLMVPGGYRSIPKASVRNTGVE
ncbi:MAG: hypothetical protein EPN93_06915 [Spirochaetes bacterium]|nr:MAG: hypothetical protein EPN93_06915 [Spirochaetota bacterium]